MSRQFQIPLAAIRQPAFLYGPDGRITVANDPAEALAGRPLAGCTAADIITIFGNRHSDGRKFTPEELPPSRALAGEEAIDVPIAITDVDGRPLHILATASPIRDGGDAIGALVVWQDVTALEAARSEQAALHPESAVRARGLRVQELERQHRLLDAILGTLPYRVSLWDRYERLVWANERFADECNEPRGALLGRSWSEFRDPVAAVEPLVRAGLGLIMAGTPVSREVEVAGPNGHEWRACTFLPFGRDALLVLTEDVTERKRAEEILRESEEKYHSLFDSIDEGFCIIEVILDGDGRPVDYRFLETNRAFERQTGLRDATGKRMRDLVPDHEEHWFEIYGAIARTGEPRRFVNTAEPLMGGWYNVYAFPVGGPDGHRVAVLFDDITPQKRAEEALRMSEARYRGLFESMTDACIIVEPVLDADGKPVDYRFLDANPANERYSGIPRDRTIGRTVEELVPGYDPFWTMLVGTVAFAGEPRSGEYRSGTTGRWFSYSAFSPAPGRCALLYRDVTTEKEAEQERERLLREVNLQNARLQTILDSLPVGVWLTDAAGGMVEVNESARSIWGGRAPYARGIEEYRAYRAWWAETGELIAADDMPLAHAVRGETLRNRIVEFERFDGTRGTQIVSAAPVRDRDGTSMGAAAIVQDITGLRQAERALRESEERLRLAQESAKIAVWDWDVRTGRYTSTPEFFRLYGLEEDRTITYDQWRERVHPDDVAWVETESQASLARGEPFDFEHRVVRPSGEVRWIQGIGRGICDGSGTLVRVLGVNIDITARKEAELELARYAESLRRSNEELQRFAYVASHDLQEPLRSIVSFSQLLERRYRGKLDADADDYIAFIVEGGVRMQALIRDLLQLSRIETEANPLEPTDAGVVVADAVSMLETPIHETGAMVSVGPMPTVLADPRQLEQVFMNLIGNAIKYRRPDVPLELRVSALRKNGWWEFAVADNGIGIEPEYFDRIFVIFQRLHTKDAYPGTGIGLALVRKIVGRHGGAVRVESVPGEGSTFFFTLPVE